MKNVYAYIGVSTAKQGEGVSLEVQRESIERYAESNNLTIIKWFEERETAAKQGRVVFSALMKLLAKREASGVVIHKIDRSARNLKNWADLGTLIDQRGEVHFAHESLDLHSRGGRLSSDIQAIIAAYYIRNLRQETLKGMYGRLRQGFYPLRAPIGYVDNEKAKYKTFHPVKAPLVRKMFDLYSTRKYSLKTLREHMDKLGLRNAQGGALTIHGISTILNNDFYIGILPVKGQKFNGGHEPLVSPAVFKRVQMILRGNTNQKQIIHDFQFRKLLTCNLCQRMLTGEVQKGIVYYRCHTPNCITKGVREKSVDTCFVKLLSLLELQPSEIEHLSSLIEDMQQEENRIQGELIASLRFQKGQLNERLERVTDLYIDNRIETEAYTSRKERLLWQLKELEESERGLSLQKKRILDEAKKIFELLGGLVNTYQNGILEEKRELIETLTSNFSFKGKDPVFSIRSPFNRLLKMHDSYSGDPNRCPLRINGSELVMTDADAPAGGRRQMGREALFALLGEVLDSAPEWTG